MHIDRLSETEQRVLGCLIEKRLTTPDQYPLTLNALRLACNQSTNRDPVVSYDEATVRDAAQRLTRYGLARLASGHTSRATKYRHLAEDALELAGPELALLAVLLLRGEQTPGELKTRVERLAPFPSLEAVDGALALLCERGYAQRVARRPGQKEDRFRQLMGEGATQQAAEAPISPSAPISSSAPSSSSAPPHNGPPPSTSADHEAAALEARLRALERRVTELAATLEQLQQG